MKNLTLFLAVIAFSTSCGNPHISSSSGDLESTNPPVEGDNSEQTTAGSTSGSTSGGSNGETTSGSTSGGSTGCGDPQVQTEQSDFIYDTSESEFMNKTSCKSTQLFATHNQKNQNIVRWTNETPVAYWSISSKDMMDAQIKNLEVLDCYGNILDANKKTIKTNFLGVISMSEDICEVRFETSLSFRGAQIIFGN